MKPLFVSAVATALLCSAACNAGVNDRPVLAQWRAAVHARLPQKGTVHLVLRGSDDHLPTIEDMWVAADGDYRVRIDRKFDSDEIVLKHGNAQRRDWEGHVRPLNGDELARLRSEAFTAMALAFGPPENARIGAVKASGDGCCDVLTLTPPGGAPFEWTIDRKTHLPVSLHKREGEGDSATVKFEDWAASSWGVQIPRKITVIDTDRVPAAFQVQPAKFSATPAAGDFAGLIPGPSDAHMAAAAAVLPFTMEDEHIVLPVSVNGHRPIGFIFDTGDESEALNSARLTQFGVETYGSTAISGGGEQTPSAYARNVTFGFDGGVTLVNQHAVTFDCTGLEHALGVPLGGILGYDFISRFVIEIDYAKKQMILHDPKTWTYRGSGKIVPVTFDDGIPYFEARLSIPGKPDLPAHMVADFGAAETMTFTAPFVQANDLRRLIGTEKNIYRYAGLDKEFFAQHNSRGLLPELRLGGIVERDIPVNLSANTSGAYGTGRFAGTVGESLYSRYRVFIDYAHNRIILEPTPLAAKPFEGRKTFGLTLIAAGPDLHSFVVTAVRPDSPAAKAGFRVRDVVAALDGKPASQFRLSDLRAELARDGKTESFTVERDGKPIHIAVSITRVSIER